MRGLLTVDEAAESLRVSRSMVYKLVSSRILPSVRVGPGTIRIERGERAEWIGERRSSGGSSSSPRRPSPAKRGGTPGLVGGRGDPPPLAEPS
jgi:excisionase family DNA binding protein